MKRPSLQFSVPCLSVTEKDGPPSFSSIFFELPFPQFPFKFPGKGFFIANSWCNGQGRFAQEIKIYKPDRKTELIKTGKQPFELKEETTPFMAVNLFQDAVFETPGTYWVETTLADSQGGLKVELEYPLVVRLADGAKNPETSAKSQSKPETKNSINNNMSDIGNIASPRRR